MEASQLTTAEPVVGFEWTEFESPSRATVEAVATATGVEPMEIEPLYFTVDPDALDDLLERGSQDASGSGAAIRFEYHDYAVALGADGEGYLFDGADGEGDWSPV